MKHLRIRILVKLESVVAIFFMYLSKKKYKSIIFKQNTILNEFKTKQTAPPVLFE